MWFFYFNVGLNVIYVLDERCPLPLICFFKKFIGLSYSTTLYHLDLKIVDSIKIKKIGCIKYTGASGAKLISHFVFFFNEVISIGISIYISFIPEGEKRDNFIFLKR